MANKKLNQLVTKPSITSGDLFPLADATTGQLYKTTISDLGTAIGSGVSSVNTLVGAVVLDTDDIQELASPVNKWYTDLRARAALSAGTGISYNSGTGIITNTITQYTDALARNAVSLTTTGSNGSATYNSSTGVLNVPAYTLSGLGGQPLAGNLTALAGLSYSSLGFIKMTGVGTLALDTNTYLTIGSAASTYVPYSGATSSVNLGSNNLTVNNVFDGFSSVTASGTQIVLTLASVPSYLVNGSGGQTIKLPDATTLPNGAVYVFNNNQSSGSISVNNNSNTLIVSIPSGGYAQVELTDNANTAGSWDRHFQAPSNVSWSTNTFDYAGSITSATWNGVAVAINKGGTGATTSGAALTNLGAQAQLNGTGFVKASGTTISYDNSVYALDSVVVKLTGTQTVAGVKTFSNQPVFNDTIMQKNTASGTVLFGGYTTLWTTDSAFTALVGTATSTTIGFSLLYDTSGQRSYTMPTANGTLALTSQLSSYLPLSGGTLTGELNATGIKILGNSVPYIISTLAGADLNIQFPVGQKLSINDNAALCVAYFSKTEHRLLVNGSIALTVNSGGTSLNSALVGTTANFSGALSGTTLALSGGTGGLNFTTSTTITNTASSGFTAIYANGGGIYLGGSASTNHLSIASGGAATFSSSVTASGAHGAGSFNGFIIKNTASSGASGKISWQGNANNETWAIAQNQTVGAGYLEFNYLGSNKVVIDPNGNVGIGTTAPYALLTVYGGSAGDRILIDSSNGSGSNGAIAWGSGGVPNISARMKGLDDGFYGTHLTFETRGNSGPAVTTTERMRITSAGNVLMGSTSSDPIASRSNGFAYDNSFGIRLRSTNNQMNLQLGQTSGVNIQFWTDNGTNVVAGNISSSGSVTSFNVTSDYRIKQDLKSFNGLDLLGKINVYNYELKIDKTRMDGVLAHELAEVLPYAVTGVKDGEQMQSVDYSKIVPVMVQAIKELKAKIETLENK